MPIHIVNIGTSDTNGGAARAMYRLHHGLNQLGCVSKIVSRDQKRGNDYAFHMVPDNPDREEKQNFLSSIIQAFYVDSNRTVLSNTLFSFYKPGFDLAQSDIIRSADIIHLHWIIGALTPKAIHELLLLEKPVVWTLHDQWAFTGGCHYSAGCMKYYLDCKNCPQLEKDPFKITEAILKDKKELFESPFLTIVAPSRWIADCAAKSSVFKNHRIELIPNSIETDIFSPLPKITAKKMFGIEPECKTILICAFQSNEKRKGFSEFSSAINYAVSKPEFRRMVKEQDVKVLFFGELNSELDGMDLPVKALGFLDSDEKIRAAYTSADLFVLPSLEDNLPNTMLEAMSCGTPIIAFSTGGIPEALTDGVNGLLVPVGDFRQLGDAIISLLNNETLRAEMGERCREKALKYYPLNVQAGHHISLYQDLLSVDRLSSVGSNTQPRITSYSDISFSGNYSVPLNTSIGSRSDLLFDAVLHESLKALDTNRSALIQQVRIKETEIQELKKVADERLQIMTDLSTKLENVHMVYEKELNLLESIAEKRRLCIEELEKYINTVTFENKKKTRRRLKDWHRYQRFSTFLEPRLGVFKQYPPRPLHLPKSYSHITWDEKYPSISIVTPSLNQGAFIERTIKSVIDQNYPYLEYQIVDGGSEDGTIEILQKFDKPFFLWKSEKDNGQSNALNIGFRNSTGEIMAYLNSDDMLLPGSLHYIAAFFFNNPDIDVVYGHRVVVNEYDLEVGRWVIPEHDASILSWADYIPQETLFWRRKIWEKAGEFIDEEFKFAMDWDLLLRFRDAGARFKRVPRFLGTFRIHSQQKTSKEIETKGEREMQQLRKRCNGHQVTYQEVNKNIRYYLNSHIILNKLYRAGILHY